MSTLTLAAAKAHLNITASTHDAELQDFIDAAEAALTTRVGPLSSTATTRRVRGCSTTLALPVLPAISLTSVTPRDASALTLADLYLDTASGVVTYNDGSTFSATYYTVVYNAGRATCPSDLLLADKLLVRHLWETQRGPRANTSADAETPGASYLMPRRVEQLIRDYLDRTR